MYGFWFAHMEVKNASNVNSFMWIWLLNVASTEKCKTKRRPASEWRAWAIAYSLTTLFFHSLSISVWLLAIYPSQCTCFIVMKTCTLHIPFSCPYIKCDFSAQNQNQSESRFSPSAIHTPEWKIYTYNRKKRNIHSNTYESKKLSTASFDPLFACLSNVFSSSFLLLSFVRFDLFCVCNWTISIFLAEQKEINKYTINRIGKSTMFTFDAAVPCSRFDHTKFGECVCIANIFSLFLSFFFFMSIFPFHMHTIWWLRMSEYWILLTFRGRRRVNTILTLITLDYRQTINITAAWFVLPANAKTAYIYEMSACYSAQNKCIHTNRTRCIHTHNTRTHNHPQLKWCVWVCLHTRMKLTAALAVWWNFSLETTSMITTF